MSVWSTQHVKCRRTGCLATAGPLPTLLVRCLEDSGFMQGESTEGRRCNGYMIANGDVEDRADRRFE